LYLSGLCALLFFTPKGIQMDTRLVFVINDIDKNTIATIQYTLIENLPKLEDCSVFMEGVEYESLEFSDSFDILNIVRIIEVHICCTTKDACDIMTTLYETHGDDDDAFLSNLVDEVELEDPVETADQAYLDSMFPAEDNDEYYLDSVAKEDKKREIEELNLEGIQ
jgi:hypothetical protein